MSSYLQRMAAGVLSHERAIHPIVGSLWAPRQDVDSAKAPGEVFVIGEGPHRAQAQEPDRAQPIDALRARPSAEPPAALRTPVFVPGIAEKAVSPLQPLLPPAAHENVPVSSDLHQAGPGESEAGPQLEASRSQQPRIFTPLIQSSAQSSIQKTAQQGISPLSSVVPASRADAVRHQPRDKAPEREPDAIEIHIGRIEVLTAPQQQEQRRPAPAPRKSLDLGEYLKRGGRAR